MNYKMNVWHLPVVGGVARHNPHHFSLLLSLSTSVSFNMNSSEGYTSTNGDIGRGTCDEIVSKSEGCCSAVVEEKAI